MLYFCKYLYFVFLYIFVFVCVFVFSYFQSVVWEIVRSTDWKCQHLGPTTCTVYLYYLIAKYKKTLKSYAYNILFEIFINNLVSIFSFILQNLCGKSQASVAESIKFQPSLLPLIISIFHQSICKTLDISIIPEGPPARSRGPEGP